MALKGKTLSEEHKRKIGEANKIANKGKHCSPKTEFKKGRISERKGKPHLAIREENHYKWTGGCYSTARTMAIRYGFNMEKCSICEAKEKVIVHHVDENPKNNKLENLRVLCYKCHNQLHGHGVETRFKKGHKTSKEVREKISMANKGKTAWNKGLKVDRKKYSNMGNFKRNSQGGNN